MSGQLPISGLLFLDACCLLNLFATDRIEEILSCLPYRCATSRLVAAKEVLSIGTSGGATGLSEREVIPPDRLERLPDLGILDLETDAEVSAFVRFALELADGEASVCALALTHQGGVATDDRKALRVLARDAPTVSTVQTPELLHDWAQRLKLPDHEVLGALRRVRDRGRFYPRRDAPKFDWWDGHFRISGACP